MTLLERAAAFKRAFAHFPASWLWPVQEQGHDVLYGRWVIGNDYRNKSPMYGAYPAGYLDRVLALFPDVVAETAQLAPTPDAAWPILHVFSGSLPPGRYTRLDVRVDQEAGVVPDLCGSVYDLPFIRGGSPACNYPYTLVLADPPYSRGDAVHYGTSMVNRGKATRAIAQVVKPGGHLVWLDTTWPMHRKEQWRTVARIALTRSTNHRARDITIFERVA